MAIPTLGAPYVVRHWLTTVVVECKQCEAGATVLLVGSQLAHCPVCAAPYACGGLEWDSERRPTPKITIGTAPPVGTASALVNH